jgi:hypothetical protein
LTALFDSTQYAIRRTQVEQFVAPPLTVLDASQGYWRQRKEAWLADFPILVGADGREEIAATYGEPDRTDDVGRKLAAVTGVGQSVFDPVLAELAYEWWTAPGDLIFDPFAGGPCRGLVADSLGREYLGVDVRQEQVDTNAETGVEGASWICADSTEFAPPPCDFVFSCPPYGSLEVYSDDPRDVSTLDWPGFQKAYTRAIGSAVGALQRDRFAAFVVGNFKERRQLRDLVSLTIRAFTEAGAEYFGDLVLVTVVGSSAIRAQYLFPRNRRPIPRHQMVLVFAKGDPRKAADRLKSSAPVVELERSELCPDLL